MTEKTKVCLDGKCILITGCAGFIGANLTIKLLDGMHSGRIVGLDNLNDYYDIKLKEYRLTLIEQHISSRVQFEFIKGTISDQRIVASLFEENKFDIVINLAAQAGVRHSIECPEAYIESNIIGFFNILEACRHSYSYSNDDYSGVKHLVYASSSSVYGGNGKVPFSIEDKVDHPVSLYAATKKSNELMAHAYSKLYDIPCTGLRFFTVYGPAGRPDMFYYSATQDLVKGGTIKIFNNGDLKRDFTYIDDIVEGLFRVIQGAPKRKIGRDGLPIPPYALYNIGGGNPIRILDFVTILQEELVNNHILTEDYDFEAHRILVGMQAGDVPETYADTRELEEDYCFVPKTGIREGIREFCEWYKSYYS